MKKIEKAMQMEIEGLREKILKTQCPHNYGMKDRAAPRNGFMCDLDCEECWSGEIEGDSNASAET